MQSLVLALALSAGIEAGSPARAVVTAHADLGRLSAEEAPYIRYFWVSTAEVKRDQFLVAFKFHLNLLSDQGKVATPVMVAPDLIRIDIRDYGWDKRVEVYERLAELDPIFHVQMKALEAMDVKIFWPGGYDGDKFYARKRWNLKLKAGQKTAIDAPWLPINRMYDLRSTLFTQAPILMAEWFFVQTCRQISIRNKDEKVGYYNWLGLKDRDSFFKLTGADPKLASKLFREWRAVVDKSGISQQNRQVVAMGSIAGEVWGTLDTFTEQGRGIAKRNLRPGEFAHNAEEWYGSLPNGLFVTFLSDNNGKAQASAPDQIGPDDSALRIGRDARVHANLSCIRCHGPDQDWLKPVDDWARRTFRQGGVLRLQDPDKKVILELDSLYLRDLNRILNRTRSGYVLATHEVTASKLHPNGLSPSAVAKLYGEVWNRYVDTRVSLETAAREIGTTPSILQKSIERYSKTRGGGDLLLDAFIDKPTQRLSRLEWEEAYPLAACIVAGVAIPDLIEERKGK